MSISMRKDVLSGGVTKKTSEGDYVFSEDGDVLPSLPDELRGCGWIPAHMAEARGPGAWVVTIRGLDGDELVRVEDNGGQRSAFACKIANHMGIVGVSYRNSGGERVRLTPSGSRNKRASDALTKWVDGLVKVGPEENPSVVSTLLGRTILALSVGSSATSFFADARTTLGYPKLPEEGDGTGDDSKSGA